MEALAARRPVVVRDLPVLREVFDGAALFASTVPELARYLAASLQDADPARTDRGQELARRHTWDRAARAHEDFCVAVGG